VAVPLAPVNGTQNKEWAGLIARDRLNQNKLDSEAGRVLPVSATDLAANPLDREPASIGRRRPDGTWEGNQDGTDQNHSIKIDTKHNEKAIPRIGD
jgi:hypothetical protein